MDHRKNENVLGHLSEKKGWFDNRYYRDILALGDTPNTGVVHPAAFLYRYVTQENFLQP